MFSFPYKYGYKVGYIILTDTTNVNCFCKKIKKFNKFLISRLPRRSFAPFKRLFTDEASFFACADKIFGRLLRL